MGRGILAIWSFGTVYRERGRRCDCRSLTLTIKWKWKSLSCVRLFAIPWTIQSMEFCRPQYWSGQPFPSPGDLPNPGTEPNLKVVISIEKDSKIQRWNNFTEVVRLTNASESGSVSRSVASDSLWPMDCNPQGSPVHEILQTRILGWVAIPFSRGSSQPRVQTWVSCIAGRFFTFWAIMEAL